MTAPRMKKQEQMRREADERNSGFVKYTTQLPSGIRFTACAPSLAAAPERDEEAEA
jgi:hypothetical protein